eukprot:scpid45847/ scgid20962/ UV radiation resistance-associated gene protein; p63
MSSSLRPPRIGKHVDLPTHQRRARHLRNFNIRRLYVKDMTGLLSSYFTLHDARPPNAELYRSEIVHDSLNPSWKSFDLNLVEDIAMPSFSTIVVRVWVSNYRAQVRRKSTPAESFKLAIEWTVDLLALVYACDHLFCLGDVKDPNVRRKDPNLLLFGMFDGYYIAPADERLSQKALAATLTIPTLTVDKESVRESYSYHQISHLNTIHRRLATKQYKARQAYCALNQRGQEMAERQNFAAQCESSSSRIDVLKQELQRQKQCLLDEQQQAESKKEKLKERACDLAERKEQLTSSERDRQETLQHLQSRRDVLYRTGTALQARRCIMLKQLSIIFPIVEQARNVFCILGVPVPHAEALSSQRDEVIGVGFGYAAHLLHMMALILNLPLRYPIIYRGSTSVIRDSISDASSLAASKGECNLYPQTRASKDTVFQYGLFLLNKNISQIRFYCDLGTADGRLTVKNIKSLLDRFAVIGERLSEQIIRPLLPVVRDDNTVDGLPFPTRSLPMIPSFEGPSGSPFSLLAMSRLTPRGPDTYRTPPASPAATSAQASNTATPVATTATESTGNEDDKTTRSLGHRRQHSAPISPMSVLVSADDVSHCLSANCSPTIQSRVRHISTGGKSIPAPALKS